MNINENCETLAKNAEVSDCKTCYPDRITVKFKEGKSMGMKACSGNSM